MSKLVNALDQNESDQFKVCVFYLWWNHGFSIAESIREAKVRERTGTMPDIHSMLNQNLKSAIISVAFKAMLNEDVERVERAIG